MERDEELNTEHAQIRTLLEIHEFNCMNDSRDFQDVESVHSGNSHVASQPVSFPRHPILEECCGSSSWRVQVVEY